ncbi:uncharacterized protein LOC142583625 [Dermacentor variabilis]|uniref:uncharacterized protein LOC142583625 n=1 Tax=Dermacentor variabilis TaxID=34621 RepID=UPI003F5B9D58
MCSPWRHRKVAANERQGWEMRRRRCFTMLLAAVFALAITTARAMPTAVTVEAAPDDASTGAVTFSDDLLTMEGQIPKDGSQFGGSRYGAIENTDAEHDVSTSTKVSAPLPEAPTDDSDDDVLGRLATATTLSGYSSDSPSNLQTEPKVRSIGDSSRGHSQLSTSIPVTTAQTETTGTYRESISEDAISPSTYPTTAPAKVLLELSDTGNESKFFGGSGTTTLADVTSEQLSSTDLSIGKEDLVSRNKETENPERERPPKSDDPDGMHKNEPIGSGRTDRGRVPAVIVSARADEEAASSSDRANPSPPKGTIGSVATALQASPAENAQSGSSGTAQVDHLMARAGEKPDMEKGAGGSSSPREDARKAAKNEKEAATLVSAPAGVGDELRQDTPGTRNLNTDPPAAARAANDPVHSSHLGNSPGQGAPTSNKPTEGTEKLDASALSKASQAGLPELGRAELPTPQQGPTGNGGKGDTVRTDDAASPKLGVSLSGRAADTTDKALEAPRNADASTAGSTNKGNEPLSPRAEQPKATGGEPGAGVHPTNKTPEVPRSADAPVGGNNKANQPESPRAEQPKAGSGESGRGDDPSSKPAEVPRTADAPVGGNNKANQPESPRAEQPKAGSGESGRGDDPSSKPAELPRSADAPGGGKNKASQPESPRAEQPKAGIGESGRGADPSSKPAEVPRSADAPVSGNNKASRPESPRAEQPKAGSGESGRGADPSSKPAEVPRSADAPVGGNNKASRPESPRAEQPKAGSGESGQGADPSSKPAEVPRSADAPVGGNNKASQPESPRAEQPKAGSGESGRGADPSSKPAEVPRSADAPVGGNNKANQPEFPRAEQPKAGSGESGRGDDPSSKPAELPRSADAPGGGNNKASQPESPRAEQPKAGSGESGRGADPSSKPAEVPRSADAPVGGNNKASRPESPRAEQPKAGSGESGRGADPSSKPAEVPRSADAPVGGNNKASQPESPRAEQPKDGSGESGRGADPSSKLAEVPRSADAPVGGNNKASQLELPRTEQSRPQQVQPLIDAGGKGETARDGDAAKLKAGGGESVRGGETVNKPQEVPRDVDVTAGANKAGQPEAPRAEQPKAQGPGKASDSSEVPRAEQQNPPTVMKAVTNKNSEGREDSQPVIPKTEVPKLPAPSSAARDGKGEAAPGKTQGTLRTDEGKTVVDVKGDPPVAVTVPEGSKTKVIVEDTKDSKEDIKKPEATKMVEATESETHISIDNHEPEKKPTAVVVQEERPHEGMKDKDTHEGMKDKDKEAVLVIKNITVEVEPEPTKPDFKPYKIVPVVPPTETVVYPPPPVLSPPYQQPPAYQPYQPYQASPYHQPSGTVVYIPQSVYQPAPHMTYVPGNMLPYQGQHMSPSYQPVQYQQPYTGYQQTAYHPVYQPTYNPVNGPAYPQAQHVAYNPAYMPSYRPQQQVIYFPRYQPPRANPSGHYIPNQVSHHVVSAPTYKGQHNPAPMAGYQAGYPPAANIPYAAQAYQNYPRYSPHVKPAYRAQRQRVVNLRHELPVVKRPGHRTLSHGGYRRNVNEQNHASQLHFAPVIAHKENSAVPIDAPALKKSPAAHPAALGPLQSHSSHSAGENPHFKASHPPKMTIWKGPIYDESHIPVAYRRSAIHDWDSAVEDMELLEIYEVGDASVEHPINTESEFV